MIAGFRSEEMMFLKDELRAVCDRFHLVTDDGSSGEKGYTATKLKALLQEASDFDLGVAVGGAGKTAAESIVEYLNNKEN